MKILTLGLLQQPERIKNLRVVSQLIYSLWFYNNNTVKIVLHNTIIINQTHGIGVHRNITNQELLDYYTNLRDVLLHHQRSQGNTLSF